MKAVVGTGPLSSEVAAKLGLGAVRYKNELCMLPEEGTEDEKRSTVDKGSKPEKAVKQSTLFSGGGVGDGSAPATSKSEVSSNPSAVVDHIVDFVCAKAVKMKHTFPYDVYA